MKKNNKLNYFILIYFILISFSILSSKEKGSESVISVEPFTSFSPTETDNKMCAFGWFKNGFILEDSSTNCTFDSIFPISGNVTLNGGILYLTSDLVFNNLSVINGAGKLDCDGHNVYLCSSIQDIGSSSAELKIKNTNIYLEEDLTISGSVKFEGSCCLNCNGKKITLGDYARVILDCNATLTIKDSIINRISAGKVLCLDNLGKIVLDDTTCIFDGNYNFTSGALKVINEVDFIGAYTVAYQSSMTSTVAANSTFRVAEDLRLEVGRKNSTTAIEPLAFEDSTSYIELDNCSLVVNSNGMNFLNGNVVFSNYVYVDINSSDSTKGLEVGNGLAANDFLLYFAPAATIDFHKGHLVFNTTNPNVISALGENSRLIRDVNGLVYLKQNLTLPNIKLENYNYGIGIIPIDDNTIIFNEAYQIFPGLEFKMTAKRYNYITSLLDGNGEVFITKGTLPLYLLIQNSNNVIRGNGSISGLITLADSSAECTFNIQGSMANNIVLNNGSISLSDDIHLTSDKVITGPGTVNLSGESLYLGPKDKDWTSSIYWDSDSGKVHLNSKVSLSNTWTFSGTCTLNGNSETLDLGSDGKIVVEKGSTLTLKQIRLENVSENNICCLDNAAKIIFDTVTFIQSADYSFTLGSFDVMNKLTIKGGHKFTYQSNQTSNINSESVLKFDKNCSFNYNPSISSEYLIWMVDSTSKVHFYNNTFYLDNDLTLSTGTVFLEDEINIYSGILRCVNKVFLRTRLNFLGGKFL